MKKDKLLDRPIPDEYIQEWTKRAAMPQQERDAESTPVLVFRIGSEWLGLDSSVVQELAAAGRVHRLPQHRSRVVLGVVNVRGQLVICISLASFLQIDQPPSNERRLIVLQESGLRLAVPADEVYGIHRYRSRDVQPVTSILSESRYTTAMLRLNDKNVACLNTRGLMAGLRKALT